MGEQPHDCGRGGTLKANHTEDTWMPQKRSQQSIAKAPAVSWPLGSVQQQLKTHRFNPTSSPLFSLRQLQTNHLQEEKEMFLGSMF